MEKLKKRSLPVLLVIIAMLAAIFCVPAAADTTVNNAEDLKNAVAAGGTIVLNDNIVLDEKLEIQNAVTINGNGHSITGSASKVFEVYANAKFENVTIINTASYGRCIDTRVGNITLELNTVTLKTTGSGNTQPLTVGGSGNNIIYNITDCTIDAGNSGYGIIVFNPVTIMITDSTVSGYAALYFKSASSSLGSAGSVVNATNSTLSSNNVHSGESNNFGTIVFNDKNITVNIDKDTTVSATSEGEASQTIIDLKITDDDSSSTSTQSNINVSVEQGAVLNGELVRGNDENDTTVTLPSVAENTTTDKTYYSLAEAINAASENDTVKLLNSIVVAEPVVINKNITLDGNGLSITSTDAKYGMWVKGDASNVTLKNVEITAKYYALNVNSTVDLTIENSKLNGWAAIYMFNSSTGSTVTVKSSVLNGVNNYNEVFGTIALQAENLTVIIDGSSTVITKVAEGKTGTQYALVCNAYDTDSNGNMFFNMELWNKVVATYKTVFPATVDTKTLIDGGYCVYENKELAGTVVVGEHNIIDVTATDATCDKAGTIAHKECTGCGTYYDANNNVITDITDSAKPARCILKKVDAKAATYTEDGNIEYYVCDSCGKYYSDANGKVEIADKTSVVIDKLVEDTSDISSPNTGDMTLVIVALAFVSAVAAGAILSIRKKGNC